MSVTPPTYRCEVVGSLLRPDYLKDAVQRHAAGTASAAEVEEARDRAVLEAIALQEDCGVEVLTDGEMRRRGWTDPLTQSLAGYGPAPMHGVNQSGPEQAARERAGRQGGNAVIAKLGPKDNLPLRELRFLKQHTSKPVKITLPSLAHASVLWSPGHSDQVYPNRDEYLQDALRLTKELIAQCVAEGCTYVQLDSPRYTHLVSEEGRENFRRVGLDPDTWLSEVIAIDNALVDAFPAITFALHLCRGNGRSMWAVEGGYDVIAEQLFNEIHVDRLFLEYDTPRAGNFAPLRFVPKDKAVVLGLITTKEPELETEDLLTRRIEEASQYLPLDQLALSPQCGFASVFEGNLITPAVQRAKLETLGKVARAVWGE